MNINHDKSKFKCICTFKCISIKNAPGQSKFLLIQKIYFFFSPILSSGTTYTYNWVRYQFITVLGKQSGEEFVRWPRHQFVLEILFEGADNVGICLAIHQAREDKFVVLPVAEYLDLIALISGPSIIKQFTFWYKKNWRNCKVKLFSVYQLFLNRINLKVSLFLFKFPIFFK